MNRNAIIKVIYEHMNCPSQTSIFIVLPKKVNVLWDLAP